MRRCIAALLCVVLTATASVYASSSTITINLNTNEADTQLRATFGESEIFVYNYGDQWNLPHFFPLNTPSGKNLLVQETMPYPHHRAFWVSDTVERSGIRGDVYNGYYSGVKTGEKTFKAPYNTAVRHVSFNLTTGTGRMAAIEEDLVWETSRTTTTFPLLDEHRNIKLYVLGNGNYFMDFSFTLKAAYGDVKFVSDAVHYSWPYLRLNTVFSGTGGGVITADNGSTGQKATNLKPAHWIDYSNTVDGETEGVAIFQWPDKNGKPRKWLTREYGTFGPRRPDKKSGKPFTLKKDHTVSQRVGIYIHRGDVKTGNAGEVYNQFVKGKITK